MYLNPKVSNMLNEETQEVISLELKIRMILSIIIIIQYYSWGISPSKYSKDICRFKFGKELKLSLYADNLENPTKIILQTIKEFHTMPGNKINIQNQKAAYLQTTNT